MQIPKSKKGEHDRVKKREREKKAKAFRERVLERDMGRSPNDNGCMNPECHRHRAFPPPLKRKSLEVAHLAGRGRSPATKCNPDYCIVLCWFCHDWADQRNNYMDKGLSADERKIKILLWWKENRPIQFYDCNWKLPLEALQASVARRKVAT